MGVKVVDNRRAARSDSGGPSAAASFRESATSSASPGSGRRGWTAAAGSTAAGTTRRSTLESSASSNSNMSTTAAARAGRSARAAVRFHPGSAAPGRGDHRGRDRRRPGLRSDQHARAVVPAARADRHLVPVLRRAAVGLRTDPAARSAAAQYNSSSCWPRRSSSRCGSIPSPERARAEHAARWPRAVPIAIVVGLVAFTIVRNLPFATALRGG